MSVETVAPVRKQVTVQAPQELAFEVFCRRMASWWNPSHHLAQTPFVDLVLEPREGGRWFERDAAGNECSWGSVLAWEPPYRVILGWQLDEHWEFDSDLVTEVEIRFVEVGPSTTRVELEHRDLEKFGHAAPGIRASLEASEGWTGLLGLFADSLRGRC
jgi:uncharacterized protein YndB with AHSA1/START domain